MMKGFILISVNETHQFLCPFHDPKWDFCRIFHMKGIIFLIFLFHGVKTSAFSLLVWLGSLLQNIRKFGSIATSSKLRDPAQSLFVHKLLLNRLLLICYTSDQKLFWATLSSHMTKAIVFFVEKRSRTDAHANYSVEHSSVKSLSIVKWRKAVLKILFRGF
jgi:hypothetical protein